MTWHEDRWDDPESRFLAFTLHDRWVGGRAGASVGVGLWAGGARRVLRPPANPSTHPPPRHPPPPHPSPPSRGQGGGDLYAAFNAHSFEVRATLPPPPAGKKWCRVVDTNLAPPKDFTPGGNAGEPGGSAETGGRLATAARMIAAADASDARPPALHRPPPPPPRP